MKNFTSMRVPEIIRNAGKFLSKGKLLFGLGAGMAAFHPVQVQAQCPPISTLPCANVRVALPFSRAFTGSEGGLRDRNNLTTGFTMAQAPSAPLTTPSNASVPGYEAGRLSVASGALNITTTAGIAYLNPDQSLRTNSGVNALGVGFSAPQLNAEPASFTIETNLLRPPAGTGNAEQAGLWFGPDENNYIKLDVISLAEGTRIELLKEVNAVSGTGDRILISPFTGLSTAAVRLRMLVNVNTNRVDAFYSVGGGTMISIGTLPVPASFITGRTTGTLANTAFAGIYTSHRNATTPLNYAFDDFKIELARPFILTVNPAAGATNVSVNASISTSVIKLPQGGIRNSTLSGSTVKLTNLTNNTAVAATINGTGGGDAITLRPGRVLDPQTTYRFEVTGGVTDTQGIPFLPFSSTFKTGDLPPAGAAAISFHKISLLPGADGQHSSLVIGPDKKLYATTIYGDIKRFPINADGTLGSPQIITSLRAHEGYKNRLLIGLAFAPSSTATNLVAYVTHHTFLFENAPNVDGKITRLRGPNLEDVDDLVINLPRSKKDHVVNSLAFGPDGALYFPIASNSAMGKADGTWGGIEEYQLSASLARLDLARLTTLPLNVRTTDIGGTYNPKSSTAALTIYASGVRNAYDLVFHSNGQLYLPTNGSAAGGNTPASRTGTVRLDGSPYNGPVVEALTDVGQTMDDFLFRVVKGGYYGHPNPTRGEYVLNGGNPTAGIDPGEVVVYPVGTRPDANWRGAAFNFENNKSPNGVIEYKNNTFEGRLKGKLLVVRFGQMDDIIVLTPGGLDKNYNIVSSIEGFEIPGFSNFNDPVDLTEDVRNGNIYVSEYDRSGDSYRITLLKPTMQEAEGAALSQATASDIHPGYSGTGFADFSDTPGSYVQFTTLVSAAGSYKLEFRYANGGTTNRPCNVTVGSTVIPLTFPPTGGWDVWRKVSVTADLVAGKNTIKLSSTGSGPNVDYMNVTQAGSSGRTAAESKDVLAGSGTGDSGIVLYPNPTADALSVTYRSKKADKVEYTVQDVLGKAVLTGSQQAEAGLNKLEMDLSAAKAGVYFLTMRINGEKCSRRFVIIR